jgi:hypothetical protein
MTLPVSNADRQRAHRQRVAEKLRQLSVLTPVPVPVPAVTLAEAWEIASTEERGALMRDIEAWENEHLNPVDVFDAAWSRIVAIWGRLSAKQQSVLLGAAVPDVALVSKMEDAYRDGVVELANHKGSTGYGAPMQEVYDREVTEDEWLESARLLGQKAALKVVENHYAEWSRKRREAEEAAKAKQEEVAPVEPQKKKRRRG